MPALLIRQTVADIAIWKPIFDGHGTDRRANGSLGGRMFRSAADPRDVFILLEWDDLERARLFADSDDLREVLGLAEATGEPEIWFLEELGGPVV